MKDRYDEVDVAKMQSLLLEARSLYPETNTGKVEYITDGETNAAKNEGEIQLTCKYIAAERKAIAKMIAIFHLQKHYPQSIDTVSGFQEIAINCIRDCLQKGYHAEASSILKLLNEDTFVLPGYEVLNLKIINRLALMELISGLARRKILTGRDYEQQAISVILDAEAGDYGELTLTREEMLAAYNSTQINGQEVTPIRYDRVDKREIERLRHYISRTISGKTNQEAE